MSRASRFGGVLAAVLLVVALRWASAVPVTSAASHDGAVRVAFRARPERIETCRDRTAEELSAVPPHMRQLRVCEGEAATYRLDVRVDGQVLAAEILHGGGLRHDRPLYVFREWRVVPGERTIEVRLTRQEPGPAAPAGVIPAALAIERRIALAARRIVLVTYDEEEREFEIDGTYGHDAAVPRRHRD